MSEMTAGDTRTPDVGPDQPMRICRRCGGIRRPMPEKSDSLVPSANPALLYAAIGCAVPLEIAAVAAWSDDERMRVADELASVLGELGDVLEFGAPKSINVRTPFVALARGLAIAAYQPGGVCFGGMHWCVPADQQSKALPPTAPARPVEVADVAGGAL